MKEDPLVSVCMTTYQHEKYIQKALEGVLMQECNFKVELIVANDHSTDGTEKIIRGVAKNHSNGHWIRHTTHKENKGLTPNFMWALAQCKGKYIAICDGDDYWTDPLKLQKQIDFLEKNDEYAICFHDVNILRKNNELAENPIKLPVGYEDFGALVRKGNYIHTPSIVIRNLTKKLPNQMIHSPLNDYFLTVVLSQYGKIKFINEVMAVYRSGLGAWGSKDLYAKRVKMAVCNALLYDYFSVQENDEMATLLLRRVVNFIKKNHKTLNADNMRQICLNSELYLAIVRLLIDRSDHLENRIINILSVKRYIKRKLSFFYSG
jgi:glycosyltransferase involved in cell wall biosynthesis